MRVAPASGLVVEMLSVVEVALIVMLRPRFAVCAGDSASVACTIKEKDPVALDLPEITPAVESNNPVGNVPLATVQLYGETPPVAASVWLYAVLTVPSGRVVVATTSVAAWAMVRLSVAEAVAGVDSESETEAVTLNVPTRSVVPEIVALGVPEAEVSPRGSPEIVHVYGATPPLAVTVAL